jgi:prevent-host-death family protein
MKHQIVSATEFKATCLALLDQIAEEGGTVTVTKRGRPMAMVGPVKKRFKSSENILAGKFKVAGDIANMDTADLWEVVSDPDRFETVLSRKKRR